MTNTLPAPYEVNREGLPRLLSPMEITEVKATTGELVTGAGTKQDILQILDKADAGTLAYEDLVALYTRHTNAVYGKIGGDYAIGPGALPEAYDIAHFWRLPTPEGKQPGKCCNALVAITHEGKLKIATRAGRSMIVPAFAPNGKIVILLILETVENGKATTQYMTVGAGADAVFAPPSLPHGSVLVKPFGELIDYAEGPTPAKATIAREGLMTLGL